MNGEPVPIWVADYVLISYGTGAIMAVPAHDERDFEFAKQFGIPIKPVVDPGDAVSDERARQKCWPAKRCFAGQGIAINSGRLQRAWYRRIQKTDHGTTCGAGTRPQGRELQAPRLAFLAPAILGRAVSDFA